MFPILKVSGIWIFLLLRKNPLIASDRKMGLNTDVRTKACVSFSVAILSGKFSNQKQIALILLEGLVPQRKIYLVGNTSVRKNFRTASLEEP